MHHTSMSGVTGWSTFVVHMYKKSSPLFQHTVQCTVCGEILQLCKVKRTKKFRQEEDRREKKRFWIKFFFENVRLLAQMCICRRSPVCLCTCREIIWYTITYSRQFCSALRMQLYERKYISLLINVGIPACTAENGSLHLKIPRFH